jgi:hypothetical protein
MEDRDVGTSNPTGKAILSASLQLFRQDPQMIWLPVMAAATAFVTFAVIVTPVALVARRGGVLVLVAAAVAAVVATSATLLFNVALCFAATDRIEGRTPTVSGALQQAWQRRATIFKWAVLSAVVGTAIRLLEERLGLIGRIVGVAGGLAWAVATFMVVPVLAFEDVGPIEALKRSSSILRQRFGTVARGGLRFGFLFLGLTLAAVAVTGLGILAAVGATPIVGVPIAVIGFAALLGVAMYASAAGMYMRTVLYRFATDRPIPDLGIDVSQAFRAV